LELVGNKVTSISELSKLEIPKLKSLYLVGNPIDDEGFKTIKELKQLESLSILETKVTPAGCKAAASLLRLTSFGMPNMSLEDQWRVKLAFDEARLEAVKRGEKILPVTQYPFYYLESGGFFDNATIERLRREVGEAPPVN
jgi:hypothetical protein